MSISVLKRIRAGYLYWRKHGSAEVIARIKYGRRIDLLKQFSFLSAEPVAENSLLNLVPSNTINWFLSNFAASSGGHINIARFIQQLEAIGYVCNVVIVDGEWMGDVEDVRNRFIRAFGATKASFFLNYKQAPAAFATVATGFTTAYFVNAFGNTRKKFYFVQDFEPWFFAAGTECDAAEATYRMNLIGLTAGTWLADKLSADYGMTAYSFGFSYDSSLYRTEQGIRSLSAGLKRVFFYARPETPRRAFELGVLTLSDLCARHTDIEVVFAGGDLARYVLDFPHKSLGKLNVKSLGEVYRSCDAALVLSMTNASLLPLELMACGTPVVSNSGPHVEWLLSSEVAKLCPATVIDLRESLEEVLFDAQEWQRLHRNGLEYAKSTSWTEEGKRVQQALMTQGCVPPPEVADSSEI